MTVVTTSYHLVWHGGSLLDLTATARFWDPRSEVDFFGFSLSVCPTSSPGQPLIQIVCCDVLVFVYVHPFESAPSLYQYLFGAAPQHIDIGSCHFCFPETSVSSNTPLSRHRNVRCVPPSL